MKFQKVRFLVPSALASFAFPHLMVSNTINAEVQPSKRQASEPAASSSELVGGVVAAPRRDDTDPEQLSHYSTGAASGSFTSTAVPLQTKQTRARKSEVLTVIDGVIETAPFLVAY